MAGSYTRTPNKRVLRERLSAWQVSIHFVRSLVLGDHGTHLRGLKSPRRIEATATSRVRPSTTRRSKPFEFEGVITADCWPHADRMVTPTRPFENLRAERARNPL